MNEFAKWFKLLDESLQCDSLQADLMQHNLTAGSVREYLIREVLQRFLPSCVSIESGQVFDSKGRRSKQVDLILFDSRVPCMRSRLGPGMFPVEGVLAAIEVKTSIPSSEKLREALNNCASVAECEITAVGDFWKTFDLRLHQLVTDGRTPVDAYLLLTYSIFPPTYVFAIQDGLSYSSVVDATNTWFERPEKQQERVPVMPRMIVAGSTVGVLDDGSFKASFSDELKEQMLQQHGAHGRVLMSFWPQVKHRLSWLASHVLMSINMRMGVDHQFLAARLDIERYMPINDCFLSEYDPEKETEYISWDGQFPFFRYSDSVGSPG